MRRPLKDLPLQGSRTTPEARKTSPYEPPYEKQTFTSRHGTIRSLFSNTSRHQRQKQETGGTHLFLNLATKDQSNLFCPTKGAIKTCSADPSIMAGPAKDVL